MKDLFPNLELARGIGALSFGQSRPLALLTLLLFVAAFPRFARRKAHFDSSLHIRSWREESNLQPMVYKTIALPLSYASMSVLLFFGAGERDRTVVASLEG